MDNNNPDNPNRWVYDNNAHHAWNLQTQAGQSKPADVPDETDDWVRRLIASQAAFLQRIQAEQSKPDDEPDETDDEPDETVGRLSHNVDDTSWFKPNIELRPVHFDTPWFKPNIEVKPVQFDVDKWKDERGKLIRRTDVPSIYLEDSWGYECESWEIFSRWLVIFVLCATFIVGITYGIAIFLYG